jgi:hypothetical protein
MKKAGELLDDLLRATRPPNDCAISMRECKPRTASDPNWIAGTGNMSPDAHSRYETAVAEFRRQHPSVDWDGVTDKDGEWRHIAKRWPEVGD